MERDVLTLSEEIIPVGGPQQSCGNLEKHEGSPRHCLVIIVHPRSEVRVGIRVSVLVYVVPSREVWWVAADIFLPLRLIYTYVVNPHVYGERQMFKVNGAEVLGNPQVDDNILELPLNVHTTLLHADGTYHRFLRDRPSRNSYQRIRSHTSR